MWNLATGNEIAPKSQWVSDYLFSSDGTTLILVDGLNVMICNTATGNIQHTIPTRMRLNVSNLPADPQSRRHGNKFPLALSPDGKTLVIADGPGRVLRFEVATGKEIAAPGFARDVADALAFSPDGKKLLAIGMSRVLLHDVEGKRPTVELPGNAIPDAKAEYETRLLATQFSGSSFNCVAYASDGKRVAAGFTNGVVAVWDTATARLLWQASTSDIPVRSVAFAQGDLTVVSAGRDGHVTWWNGATGQTQRNLDIVGRKAQPPKQTLNSAKDSECSFFVFGAGTRTAFAIRDWQYELEEWELASSKLRRKLNVTAFPADFSSDGRAMLTVGENAYHLIDLVEGKPLRSFACNGGCRFSPDCRAVAGIVNQDTVRFWDSRSGTVLASIQGHHGGFRTLAFSPDSKVLATCGGDGTILLWNTPALPPRIEQEQQPQGRKPISVPVEPNRKEELLLPTGATTRLGSSRLNNGSAIAGIRYLPDGASVFAMTLSDYHELECTAHLAVWHAVTGKLQSQTEINRQDFPMGYEYLAPPVIRLWQVSPDGKFIATFNLNGRNQELKKLHPFCVREVSTGKILPTVNWETGGVVSLQFAPDGKSLATACWDSIRLFDLATGRERRLGQFKSGEFQPRNAFFSPDGKILLAVGSDEKTQGEIRWWHLDHEGPINRFPFKAVGTPGSNSIVFAPDSKHIALFSSDTGDEKPHLILAGLETGKIVRDFGPQVEPNALLFFSPNGQQIASLGKETLRRWDLATGKEAPALQVSKNAYFQFSPDGKMFGIASQESLRTFDTATGTPLHTFPMAIVQTWSEQIGHSSNGAMGPFAFSPNGKTLATAARRTIRQWDVATGKEIEPTPNQGTIHSVAVSQDARFVAACTSMDIRVMQAATGQTVLLAPAWLDSQQKVVALTALALSADGRRLAAGGSDGTIALFDVQTSKRLSRNNVHDAAITSLTFSGDAKTLVSADLKFSTSFWDAATGGHLRKVHMPTPADIPKDPWMTKGLEDWHELFEGPYFFTGRRLRPVLSPQGDILALASQKSIDLFDAASAMQRGPGYARPNQGKYAISKDGRLLVVGPNWDEAFYRDFPLHLVDTATGADMRVVANFPEIRDFAISPDGKLLAACGPEGLRIWDTATGTFQAAFNGHLGVVTTVAFSPDGGTQVSAAQDGTLLLWDVAALLARPAKPDLSAADLKTLWDTMSSSDAIAAGDAMRRLVDHPRQATALLRGQLKAATAPKDTIAKLVADLDDAKPKTRASAMKELELLAEIAEPALQACLAATPTLEQRMRVTILLNRLGEPIKDPEKLRGLRAVEVLELLATPEAAEVLRTLTGGAEGDYVTREALAAYRRVSVRYSP